MLAWLISQEYKIKHSHYCFDLNILKKNAKAHIFRYRLEMFLYLLYTTKEHVTLRLLEQACSDSLQSNKAHGKAIALLL